MNPALDPGGANRLRPPCPLTLLAGYLGAGKTTVLNHLLRHARGRHIAVVINDFGAVNIDADLIEGRSGQTISIAGGCLCCSFGDDLLQTLDALRNAQPPFDHIVIEASGVALPRHLRASVSLAPGIAVMATVVLADAEAVQRQATDRYVGDTVHDQLQSADLLLMSKCDVVPSDVLDTVEAWLRTQVDAPLLRIAAGAVPLEVLLGEFERTAAGGLLAAPAPARAGLQPPPHVTARFDSEAFSVEHPVDPQRLAAALAALAPTLVRAKGLVYASDGTVHAVQLAGRRTHVAKAPAGTAGPGRLVAIAAGLPLDRQAVRAAIATAARPA
jgi:G3E family GTPase